MEPTTAPLTYRIPACNVEALHQRIADVNKTAAKLGVSPITITEIGQEIIKYKNAAKVQCERVVHIFTLEGCTPKLEGWTFVAVIERLGAENLIRVVPGQECPVEYRRAEYNCDHCNKQRTRNEVFVLRHEDGSHKQVGRSCIKDFLGGKSPEAILAWAEIIFELDETCRNEVDGFGGDGGTRRTPNIQEFVATVCIAIRKCGWISSKAAQSMFPAPMTTSYLAWRICTEGNKPVVAQMIRELGLEVEDRDTELATSALEWATALPTTAGDYIYNLGVAVRSGICNFKTIGIIASVIAAYQKHMEREEELNRKAREPFLDEHVGEVKARMGFENVTVKAMKYFEGEYGVRTMVRFKDTLGRTLIWWTGECEWLKEGETYNITGTIKEHGEHNNYKQTILTRVADGLPKVKKPRVKKEKKVA